MKSFTITVSDKFVKKLEYYRKHDTYDATIEEAIPHLCELGLCYIYGSQSKVIKPDKK